MAKAKRSGRGRPGPPPRRCIFCQVGRVTGEHLWPRWMHRYLPKLQDARKEEAYTTVQPARAIVKKRTKDQQGHVYTKQFYVVCKACNEGWMSRIEEAAKPILIPLLRGQPVTLTQDDQIKLARWISLKVVIAEQENPSDAVVRQPARTLFMEIGKIPAKMKIYVANHDNFHWYTVFMHQSGIGSRPGTQPIFRQGKNLQTSTFTVGHLFTYTVISTIPGFSLGIDLEAVDALRQLWPRPPRSRLSWPPPKLPDAHLYRIANGLDALYVSPRVQWRDFPPGTP
jgi:hypothetical protein